jgi:hypothetical protein
MLTCTGFLGLCCKKLKEDKMSRERLCSFRLSNSSEQPGDQYHLAVHIPFVHPLHLPFPHHVHHLEPLQGSPSRLEGEKAHPWLCQPFDEAMILFDQVVEILDLSQFTVCGNESYCFEFIECLGIGRVFVDIDDPWRARMRGSKRFHKEALGCFSIPG